MKNSKTTLLAAALFTLTLASQSAMAMNEDSGSYDTLNGKSGSELSLPTASFHVNVVPQAHDNTDKGFDSAYVGSTEVPQRVRVNVNGDHSGKKSLGSSLSYTIQ